MSESFGRLHSITTLLESHSDGLSIKEIAARLCVPVETIAQDLELLFMNSAPVETDCIDDDPYQPDVVWYMLKGCYVPALSLNVQEAVGLLLSFEERNNERFSGIVSQLKGLLNFSDAEIEIRKKRILIKGARPLYPSPEIERRILILRRAAERCKALSICYYSRSESTEEDNRVDPLGVVFEGTRGVWYLVARQRSSGVIHLYNTLRIKRIDLLPITFNYPQDFNLDEYFRLAWGIEIGTEPVRVKVRFYPHFDVQAKVRKTVRTCRPSAQLTEEADGSLTLEDTISGTQEFRRWLRGFGRSAEVLEPKSLRDEILTGARLMLARYNGEDVEYGDT